MQDFETILKQIYELLDPLVEEGVELREEADFVADLGFDSLKVMKLLEKVEDHYDISIPLNILPDIQTVKDFVLQLQKLGVSSSVFRI
jgi:acyl carrier protein